MPIARQQRSVNWWLNYWHAVSKMPIANPRMSGTNAGLICVMDLMIDAHIFTDSESC